jgi:hypothetical protein
MLKLLGFVALFGCLCWFGTTVPLGSHTLFGHLHAISETKESQDLFDGTKLSAKPLVDNVRRRIAGVPEAPTAPSAESADAGAGPPEEPPEERLTSADRRRLRKLLGGADRVSVRP